MDFTNNQTQSIIDSIKEGSKLTWDISPAKTYTSEDFDKEITQEYISNLILTSKDGK